MAVALRPMLALLMAATMLQAIHATVYKVGDSAGWTTIANVDYKSWSATKTFQLGDVIIFEYNPQFHNVMKVTHAMYKACNTSAPLATYNSGNDSITITNRGHHLFLCGAPGHCQAGQKVDINVPRHNMTTPLAISPSSSSFAAPSPSDVPSTPARGPSPNTASSSKALERFFVNVLGLSIAFTAVVVARDN